MEKGKIDYSQLAFMVAGFTIGSSLVIIPGQEAEQSGWIAILIGMAEGMAIALIFTLLAARFRGKTLVEISNLVYGPYLGKPVAAAYLWFLFHLGSLVTGDFSDFISLTSMPRTPSIIFPLSIILICVYAAHKGIEAIARSSQLMVPLIIITVTLTFLLLLPEFSIDNLRPVLDIQWPLLLRASHSAAAFPFAETVAFLMVIPFLNPRLDFKKAPLYVWLGLFVAGLPLAAASVRNTGVLGATAAIYVYPSFEAARLIEIANVLTGMEVIILVNLLMMGFIKITITLYGAALGLAQLTGLRDYRPLVLPLGILMALLSIINYTSLVENIQFAHEIWPIYAPPFQLGIPLLTLIIALLRKQPREGRR